MKAPRTRIPLLLALAGAAVAPAAATVTLSDTTVTVKGETVPVYVLENQWLKVAIVKDQTSANETSVNGQVLAYYIKNSSQPDTSQLSIIQNSAPYVSQSKSYLAYRDRFGAPQYVDSNNKVQSPNVVDEQPGATVTGSVDTGGTLATVTVDEQSGTSVGKDAAQYNFTVQKIYRLRDNAKYLEVEYKWTNNQPYDYYQIQGNNGIDPLIYLNPGGASGSNDPQDTVFIKAKSSTTAGVATLTATNASNYYGGRLSNGTNPVNFPSGNGGEPVEGWIGVIDPAANVALVNTWDLAQQKAALHPAGAADPYPAEVAVRGGIFSNRITFEPFYQYVPASGTLDYTMYMIGDTDLASIGFAREGQLVAGITTDKSIYATGATATATIKLNSLNPTADVTYDLKNIRVVDASTGNGLTITSPDILGVVVPSNAHVTAGQPQISLADTGLASDRQYVVKADVYVSGQTTPITTLISTPFVIGSDPVHLLKNTDGNYLLMNENMQMVINPLNGQVKNLFLASNGRNQTVTSLPGYPMFQDYVKGSAVNPGTAKLNPNNTDTPTKKSISFSASITNVGTFTKTYTLESQSKAVQVDFKLANTGSGNTAIPGDAFYSKVPMNPGGTAGTSDVFTTHAGGSFFYNNPSGSARRVFGASVDASGAATLGDQPEIDEPWMGVADRSTSVTDALAFSWDLTQQKQYSPKPDGTTPVTYNVIENVSNYASQNGEVHFVNVPAGGTVSTTTYLMADTGFRLIGYAKGKDVMAGLWTDQGTDPNTAKVYAGSALAVHLGLTNTDTASHTFDLKNIRLVDAASGTATPGPADVTGIALAAGDHAGSDVSLPIASSQSQTLYNVQADLYEGATKIATLQTLPFNVVSGPSGDVNMDGTFDVNDVILALKIASGLEAPVVVPDPIANGDLSPSGGDNTLAIEDVAALLRKLRGK